MEQSLMNIHALMNTAKALVADDEGPDNTWCSQD